MKVPIADCRLPVENRSRGSRTRRGHRAFTLLEVMLAAGIFFLCVFGVLAVVSNCLRNARALQRQTVDMGSVAGQIYVQLSLTNQIAPGEIQVELKDTFPEYTCVASIDSAILNGQIASNGLCQVDILMRRQRSQEESRLSVLMYLPQFKEGGRLR